MKKRLLTVALAASVLFSFTACDILGILFNRNQEEETEPSESETTTVEETTTTEETTTEATTTTEETTTEETTTTSETTTESITPETSATPTSTPAPAKKAKKKVATKPTYIPKGWSKTTGAWGKTYKGRKIYVIVRPGGNYKGWYNGKWITLYDDTYYNDEESENVVLYRDKAMTKLYYKFVDKH